MKIFIAGLLLALVSVWPSFAQNTYRQFVTSQTIALSAASFALTVQADGSNKSITFVSTSLTCDGAAVMSIEIDGTAATTTSASIAKVGRRVTATADAFHTSNVGAGTVIGSQTLAADAIGVFGLGGVSLPSDGETFENLTLTSDSITATCTGRIVWRER